MRFIAGSLSCSGGTVCLGWQADPDQQGAGSAQSGGESAR